MEDIIQQLENLDTTSVSDAMDRLGIAGGLLGIKPVAPKRPMCGPAFTVHYVPCGLVKGTVGDFLDDVAPGQIVVIDNAGRNYCTVWGDIMTIVASNKKVGGTLIDGVCRDVPGIYQSDYPIYTKGCYMVTGKDRVEVDAVNIPVAVSGIQVRPRDIILADDSGAVVIPLERAAQVLEAAQEIATTEQKILDELAKGRSLREARAQLHYHSLQTRTEKV